MCTRSNEVTTMARRYEAATRSIHCAQYFRERPVVPHAILDSVSDTCMELHFSLNRNVLPSKMRINMSALGLDGKPVENNEEFVLKWSKRLYDLKPEITSNSYTCVELSGDKYIYQTSSISWRKLVEAITTSNHDDIVQQIIDVSGKLCDPSSSDRYVMDVTSEGVPVNSGKQLCDFSMTLRNASLIQVQMSADMFKGLPSPRLQLFNLTHTLDICIEHRMNPVQCFANVMTRSAAKQSYPDVAAYQSNWLPVIAMEAAKDAVHSNSRDQILVHHVPIVWTEQTVDGLSVFKGVFQMPEQFCLNRAIFFCPPDVEHADETDVLSNEVCLIMQMITFY